MRAGSRGFGWLAPALVAGAVVAACDGASDTPPPTSAPDVVVRDSAGVRIVENGPTGPSEWTVEAEPLFSVGWDADGPLWSWTQSGRVLPDGGALIGEFSQGTVYRLGPDGGVVETWGRQGQGPDEYQGFDSIILHGDSVLVSDARLGRVTIRGPDGGIRIIQLPTGLTSHRVSTVLPDGRLILERSDGYGGAPSELRPEWVFETEPVVALTPDGGDPQVLAELPHLRRWYGARGAPPGIIRIQGRAGGFDEGFAWARSDLPEVRWYDGSGTLLQVARWDDEAAPLDAAWREEFLREMGQRMGLGAGGPAAAARSAELEERLDLHDGPLPSWGEFRVDGTGAV